MKPVFVTTSGRFDFNFSVCPCASNVIWSFLTRPLKKTLSQATSMTPHGSIFQSNQKLQINSQPITHINRGIILPLQELLHATSFLLILLQAQKFQGSSIIQPRSQRRVDVHDLRHRSSKAMLGQHFPALAEAKHRFAHTLEISALHPFQQLQRRGEHEPWVCFCGFGKNFLWLVCLLEKICFFCLGGTGGPSR